MTAPVQTIALSDVVWRKDLYPRFEPDPATIQRYAESLEHLPPVEVNQHNELIDGYHRWTAHKVAKAETIAVTVTPTESDAQFLRLAIERNVKHGLQMSQKEKEKWAGTLYRSGEKHLGELAKLFRVNANTMTRWLSAERASEAEEQERQIRDLWLACFSQQEIENQTKLDQATVSRKSKDLCDLSKWGNRINLATFAETNEQGEPLFKPPLYNIWSYNKKSNGTSHFGNTEQRIVDNLLYLYTQPFDVVVDPFAGGGATIDVCKRRLRRYWVADRLPNKARTDIRTADVTDGPPAYLPWRDVALVYLDPPYWRQAKDQYSTDAEDLANMELDAFYAVLVKGVKAYADKMRNGSHIALIIQPTQWLADEKKTVDHVFDLVSRVGNGKLRYAERIICPYQTEQYNPQQVEWAKAEKRVLTLNRELIIWEVIK